MIQFGTGGWRARIGEDFTCDNVRRVGGAVCAWLKENGRTDRPVIIGYDRRFLSCEAAKWLAEVFCAQGFQVLFLHRSAPTPLLMHTVLKQHLHCALQVTASHNPAIYNGIKLIVEEGRDAPVETTQRIEALANGTALDTRFVPFAVGEANGSIQYVKNPFNDFLDDILARINGQAIRDRGLRILFDSMHGSGTYALMVILHTVRCTVDVIHTERDAYFGGIAPAPSEHSLGELSEKVVDGGYDLGIALDGDGDRLGIIDSSGRYIAANEILVMLYYYLHEYKGWKGPVVRNMSTTHMLDAVANALGEACYEVPVGFKWVSAKMAETDAVIGGESSGGMAVRGHISGKDGIYAAALLVEMLAVTGKSVSELFAEIARQYGDPQWAEADFRMTHDHKAALQERLFVRGETPDFGKAVARICRDDGCKVYFADGSWVICRFSGTEPLLRMAAEADTQDEAERYIRVWRDFLKL